jgi:hypothetical protein
MAFITRRDNMFKTFLLLASLVFSSAIFADETKSVQLEISEEKGVDRHYYHFGSQWINTRSYINYRVTNTGTTPLVFQRAVVGGANFYARHNCTGILNPGARCQFTIEYAPFFEGYHMGYFRLSFNQGYEIHVDVSGDARRM